MPSDSEDTDDVQRREVEATAEQEVAAAVRKITKPISSLPAVCFQSREFAFTQVLMTMLLLVAVDAIHGHSK